MTARETPGIPAILRSIAGWVALVGLGTLTLTVYGPRTPLGYTPWAIRFVACGSLATVAGAQVITAFGSAFITVFLAQALVGRTMSSKARVVSVLVLGTGLFALSFGGALLLRLSFSGVCA
jgi:hypothetical protein